MGIKAEATARVLDKFLAAAVRAALESGLKQPAVDELLRKHLGANKQPAVSAETRTYP